MLNPKGAVGVFFSKSLLHIDTLPRPAIVVTSYHDNWNDFGHNFFAKLHILTEPSGVAFSIDMRLMFQGESRTNTYLEKLFTKQGPLIPRSQIQDLFCSILIDPDAYKEIVSRLTLDEAVYSLLQLGDAVVIEAFSSQDPRRELIRSKDFHFGALRGSGAFFAWRHARRQLRRNPTAPVADAASNFTAKFHMPGLANAYEVDFDFQRNEPIRNRIAVLIGKNGVGKTQFLLSIIKAAARSAPPDLLSGALTEASFDPEPSFNSLLVFSSVVSDPYPSAIAPWEGDIDYQYFSLIERGFHPEPHEVNELTAALVDIIRSDDYVTLQSGQEGPSLRRRDILWKAIDSYIQPDSIHLPLLSDTPNEIWRTAQPDSGYVSLRWLKGEQRTLEIIQRLDWTRPPIILTNGKRRRLSSGQLAMLRFATQATAAVHTGSLLLLDEPETHLHPNFISAFVNTLHTILAATNSCAIIATHSAYIVREIPRSRVRVLSIEGDIAEVSQPRLQTFAASIDSISQFVFGDAEREHLHQILLRTWLDSETSITNIDEVLSKYGTDLNPESLSYIRRILDKRG
jgi:ABC-type dipeptide/oligopeptide/nickel transport system ATPase subunit